MINTSYILYEIERIEEVNKVKCTPINFAPDTKYNHEIGKTSIIDFEGKNIKWCKEKNYSQVITLIAEKKELEKNIDNIGSSSKLENQLDFVRNTIVHFSNWFSNNGFPLNVDTLSFSQQPERKFKYQEYEEFFNGFLTDSNANPGEVKEVLNNKLFWENPSEYLRNARRKAGLTVSELKAHPGFTWIDPKGTAKD
jgi:hypothetical protein